MLEGIGTKALKQIQVRKDAQGGLVLFGPMVQDLLHIEQF
jgi:hypothetical protein